MNSTKTISVSPKSSLLFPDLDQNDRLAKIHEYYRKVSVDCSICCDNLRPVFEHTVCYIHDV